MKYEEMKKGELLAEVEKRKAAGADLSVDATASKGDIIAVLELDDEARGSSAADQNPGHKALATADGIMHREVPDDLEDYKGAYKYLPTGEVFGLKVLADNEVRAHKTHHAKSPLKFWDGTAAEFRALFDKV
jgi:hypothetical protein